MLLAEKCGKKIDNAEFDPGRTRGAMGLSRAKSGSGQP